MNLTETPEIIQWEPMQYVYMEKEGSFMETAPVCWGSTHRTLLPELKKQSPEIQIEKYCSLYKLESLLYRAGVSVNAKPNLENVENFSYTLFEGGKYAKFVLTGSYSNLPKACQRVGELIVELALPVRSDGFRIEHYVKDPMTTPEDELITEIMIPIE